MTASVWREQHAWRRHAACKGTDCARFFSPTEWFPGARPWAQVDPGTEALCARCPVREECLSWALETGDEHGYLGGTTPAERDRLRRGISRKGCPVCHSHDLVRDAGRQVCLSCGMSWPLKTRPVGHVQTLLNAEAV